MHHRDFIRSIDDEKIVAAIKAAESGTSGEIRVFVSGKKCKDAMGAAAKHFDRLGMVNTKHRNGVLIFVAPASRVFAIYGDVAVHEKCGDGFWVTLRDEMQGHLKGERYTEALVTTVARAGELLKAHFPAVAGEKKENELPDGVERD